MPTLFMLLIGGRPAGRHIEQHDVFFAVGKNIREILPQAMAFWPEVKTNFHLDAWRKVTRVDNYAIRITEIPPAANANKLFFINLGGYKQNEFEEFHYKMLIVAPNKNAAIKSSKTTAFFRHTGFKAAVAHVDNKYGVDVDDLFEIPDILPAAVTSNYHIVIEPASENLPEDDLHLGYFKPNKIDKWAPGNDDA